MPNGEGPLAPATRLRRLIENPDELLVCPGVYDGFSARIALQTGFDALYMVSYFIQRLTIRTGGLIMTDRRRNHGIQTWPCRPWHSSTPRHARARRDDRQSGPQCPSHSRHGHRLRRSSPLADSLALQMLIRLQVRSRSLARRSSTSDPTSQASTSKTKCNPSAAATSRERNSSTPKSTCRAFAPQEPRGKSRGRIS